MTMVPLNVSAIDRYLEAHVGARRAPTSTSPPARRRSCGSTAG